MNGPIRIFSTTYVPDELTGYAASHHPDRADRFQQLAGALLLQQYGNDAHLSTTRGRDGSIDAFVESPTTPKATLADGLCARLATPVIVECKDHETSTNTFTNVLQGWRAMEAKLLTQERNGWVGQFRPWLRSRSYVYCVSAQLTLGQRDDLRSRIETFFFQTLPQPSRLPITEVRLVDWNDLRAQLNENGKLIDAWLGTRHTNITSHQELLRGFSGFRTLLRQDKLHFIELDTDSAFTPRRLYETLNHPDGPAGVVLVGAGGIGKSRTAIEVATLADEAGWRVLHIQPGEPAVSSEDIQTILSLDNNDTLLVFDYLEQATLDFQALTHRVLGAARIRGQRVRLLGTARPNTLRTHHARDGLFERVEMSIDGAQQSRLSQQLVHAVAPTAIATLGAEAITATCGHRPIIAVIIARDLERLAQRKRLSMEHLKLSPPGDLLARLRAQLDSQRLAANSISSGGLLPDPPQPDLILAATVLATTPYDELSFAEAVSHAIGGDNAIIRSQRIITHLRTLGWLDIMGGTLYSAHDVVADELLQRVFWDADSRALHLQQFQQLLAPLLSSSRLLGRFAVAFSRLQPGLFRDAVAAASAQWLVDHARELGNCWALASTDESAYALGATLEFPEWAAKLISHWNVFIQPWLDQHSGQLAARHLLYRGLKSLPAGARQPLMVSADHWLKSHHLRIEAGFVLAPLLEHDDLGALAANAIQFAIDWLDYHVHARAPESSAFVLKPLLERTDLAANAPIAVKLAMAWLDHGSRISTFQNAHLPTAGSLERTDARGFVLKPLLERNDLGAHAPVAIEVAVAWLNREGGAGSVKAAQFVFNPLLRRHDLGTHAHAAIEIAMHWLNHEGRARDSEDAAYVLVGLAGRDDLGSRAPAVINLSMGWLHHTDRARISPWAEYLLDTLLKRNDLNLHSADLINLAMDWLNYEDRTRTTEATRFILTTLLRRNDLGARADEGIDLALRWLNHENRARCLESAHFVITRLVERIDLGDRAPLVIGMAQDWLDHEDRARRAGSGEFIFSRLLKRKDLTLKQREKTRLQTIEWLSLFPDSDECSFSLAALLADRHSKNEEHRVLAFALNWLETRYVEADSEFVLKRLLRCHSLNDEQWCRSVRYASSWLASHAGHREYPYVLSDTLLRGHCLETEQREHLLGEARALLDAPSLLPDGFYDMLRRRLQAVTHGKAIQGTNTLVSELQLLASSTSIPDKLKLQEGLEAVQLNLSIDKPARAGFYIPSLLALSHRTDDTALRESILEVAKATVYHPEMGPINLRGMRKSASKLAEENAWPNQTLARNDMLLTGLLEPVDIR